MNLRLPFLLAALLLFSTAHSQRSRRAEPLLPTPSAERLAAGKMHAHLDDDAWTAGLDLRCVGPTVMSGRVVDLSVNPDNTAEFLVAYATGGLWHTTDHGTSFSSLYDHETTLFIGAIAVDWAKQTIWVGTGEVNSSRSSYAGVGMMVSRDWGAHWTHSGLSDSHHIGRVILGEEGTIYVAALGPLYTDNEKPAERGVFKSEDEGKSWKRILDGSEAGRPIAGAVDLIVDDSRPGHMVAALWDRSRKAWSFTENGAGSGAFETTDGGQSWTHLTTPEFGFPDSPGIGRIGLAHHAGENRLYVIVDNQNEKPEDPEEGEEKAALKAQAFRNMSAADFAKLDTTDLTDFLSENGFPEEATADKLFSQVAEGELKPDVLADYLGDANADMFNPPIIGAEVYQWDGSGTWSRTHEEDLDEVCYSYCYYFGLISVDPSNANRLIIGGVPLLESTDSGANWSSVAQDNVHVDHHHIWIDPANPQHMINGNDGGINVTFDGGAHWTSCNTPAVGQFYAVAVDNATPYRIYGGLQDNGTWRGPSTYSESPRWHQTGKYPYARLNGGDGMQIEVDTRDNETVYTGYQFGWYNRANKKTGDRSGLHPKHELGETPLRWNWQTPIHLSRHHQDILYMASNRVHRSLDQGENFETMSGDLTRGPVAGNVPYGSLTSIHESPLRFGRLAVGSDDGLVHLSPDGGYTWENRTPPAPSAYPDRALWVTEVLWSHHAPDRIFATLNGYRHDHFAPYLYVSEDNGRNWTRRGDNGAARGGLPMEPINALVESQDIEGLLFCGTDGGLYASLNNGMTWSMAHPDLPRAPVHDLVIQERENELVVGTHGRSIWVLDIDPLVEGLKNGQPTDSKALSVTEPEPMTWQESWGERSYGWGEVWEPEVALEVFIPTNGDHLLQLTDSLGDTVASHPFDGLRRGWQTLTFSPKSEPNESQLPVGEYTLVLSSIADPKRSAQVEWAVVEPE